MADKTTTEIEALEGITSIMGITAKTTLPLQTCGELSHLIEHLKSFTSDYKKCWKCNKRRPLSQFRYNGSIQAKCKVCNSKIQQTTWQEISFEDAVKLFASAKKELLKLKNMPKELVENIKFVENYLRSKT